MDQIEKIICKTIDDNAENIKEFGRDIWTHAELGYREYRTSQKFSGFLNSLGIETETGIAITGVRGYLKDKKSSKGPTLAIQGEFDALPMPEHKDADPVTGAAHCCGHHAQITSVIGAAIALSVPEVKAALDGNVCFLGIPAEESCGIEFIRELRSKGLIKYAGGKQEFIRLGIYDDVDMCLGNHAGDDPGPRITNGPSNAFLTKYITFHGIATHASATPQMGVDALQAAAVAMHAVDAQRESFREKDKVRIHGMIVKNAEKPNIVADDVRMEYIVRSCDNDALKKANEKVERAMLAGAVALGCGLTIETEPGYMSKYPIEDMSIFEGIFKEYANEYKWEVNREHKPSTASSDEGDVSCILPFLKFNMGGVRGPLHNPNLEIYDEYALYVLPAKIFALAAYRYLKDSAAAANKLISEFRPLMTKEEYLRNLDSIAMTREYPMNPIVQGR